MKTHLNTIILSLAIIITSYVLGSSYKDRNKAYDIISVTGLGKKDFTSDLIVWGATFSRKRIELKEAYRELNTDRDTIKAYLISKGIKASEIVFSSVEIEKEHDYINGKYGESNSVFSGYRLTQRVQIESKEVDKIENISREVTELINLGVELSSEKPEYFYTKLAELKIEMIAAATKDANIRAQQIAENSGGELGKLKYANMGVFQITAQNSSEDFSWGGTFNASSKNKTASITMKLQYESK